LTYSLYAVGCIRSTRMRGCAMAIDEAVVVDVKPKPVL
jgi:hypothetical protein